MARSRAETLLIRSLRLAVGKTLAYTSIRFTNSKEELVARGSHTKYGERTRLLSNANEPADT